MDGGRGALKQLLAHELLSSDVNPSHTQEHNEAAMS